MSEGFAGLLLAGVFSITTASGQESEHAQPPAEVEVAQEFKAAAPELFKKWLEARPEQLRDRGRGELANLICTPNLWSMLPIASDQPSIQFLECKDSTIPTEYRIDVRKTDSVLTPFEGLIIVPVKMSCSINAASSNRFTAKKRDEVITACVGASYEQCLDAGGKRFPGIGRRRCVVEGLGLRLETPFSYEGAEYVTYGWTGGRWEFQKQHEEPALRPTNTGGTKKID